MGMMMPARLGLAAALLWGGAIGPASAAPKPVAPAASAPAGDAVPTPDQPPAQSDEGGAGYLPGSRFQRRIDGGPGFVCTATNALHDQQCTASCRVGETADCVDADGGAAPSCTCTKD